MHFAEKKSNKELKVQSWNEKFVIFWIDGKFFSFLWIFNVMCALHSPFFFRCKVDIGNEKLPRTTMFVQLCSFQLSPMFKKYQHKKSLNECKILHSNLKNTSLQIAIHCNFMLFLVASSVHKNAVTRNFSGDWSKNWITHSSVILSLKREIDGDRRSRRREEESEPANCVTSFPRDA